jgi:acyl dehydratase
LPTPSVRNELSPEAYRELTGRDIGVTAWRLIDQDTIDRFADVTNDVQFVHVDPVRAQKEGPFGRTVAHGLLTLSLLPTFAFEALPVVEGTVLAVNYGFDKVRFLAPVPSGARVRGRFVLRDAVLRSAKELQSRFEVTVEIEGSNRPALAADWLTLTLLK